jgi:hypothetical protein
MSCSGCQSDKQRVFNGEIAVHFPGLEGLDKPIVWVFPELVVCLDCGFTGFAVPERELQILKQGFPADGTLAFSGGGSRPSDRIRIRIKSISTE